MSKWQKSSTAKQLALYLREEIIRRRWTGKVPGVIRLANELGVAKYTVEEAMRELERDGLLKSQGKGRGRIINLTGDGADRKCLRIGILTYEASDRNAADTVELLHELREMGHAPFIADRTLTKLDHKAERVARLVKKTPADAWVIMAGSQEVLEWFAQNKIAAFAYAGRADQVPIANVVPDKSLALLTAIRRMFDLGHRRIVMLVRDERRKPSPGLTERQFLQELQALGIATGPYNLPDWECSIEGFHACLESLFQITPPTALIIGEAPFVMAAFQFCLTHGIKIPERLSLLCGDPSRDFEWCKPAISHIDWNYNPIHRRILRWVNNVSQGKPDMRKSVSEAIFVNGGTIGPAEHAIQQPHSRSPIDSQ